MGQVFSQNLKDYVLSPQQNIFKEFFQSKGLLKPQEEEKTPEEISISQEQLDQLYEMGFPLSLCKKALKECQNASYDHLVNYLLEQDAK